MMRFLREGNLDVRECHNFLEHMIVLESLTVHFVLGICLLCEGNLSVLFFTRVYFPKAVYFKSAIFVVNNIYIFGTV